jgi:collagenase-like PrtC family protease
MILVAGSRGNAGSTRAIIDGTGGRIGEIYLSVENSRWGSGRSYVYEVGFDGLAGQAAYAGQRGVSLSLAFNTVCLGRRKFTGDFMEDFRRLLREARASGIGAIILSDPFLMEAAKREMPGMAVIVSVFAEAASENRLLFYNHLGADRIIIPHELNRDLPMLERFARLSRAPLEVILNLGCSHYCPWADAHSTFTGHFCGDVREEVVGDCYTTLCNYRKLARPWEVLSQDWIRPEDVHRYEDIGISYFKIAGRATSTSWIIRTANAYLDRSWDGSLRELISPYYPFTDRMPGGKSPFAPIPNKALDGVMDRLYACGHRCGGCGVCREIFRQITGDLQQKRENTR